MARPARPTSPPARALAGLLAGGLLLAPLAGCTIGSDSVSCTTSACSVTLTGADAEVEVLGTRLALGGVQDGRASLEVAGASVSCEQGQQVEAGTLVLECTSVTEDAVELTASLG